MSTNPPGLQEVFQRGVQKCWICPIKESPRAATPICQRWVPSLFSMLMVKDPPSKKSPMRFLMFSCPSSIFQRGNRKSPKNGGVLGQVQ